jgi:hypothetical protein
MDCLATGQEVQPKQVAEGVLQCPACGEILDEKTLRSLVDRGDRVLAVHRKSTHRWRLAGGPQRGDSAPASNKEHD